MSGVAGIRIDAVNKTYGTGAGALVALGDVSLEIPAGRFVSVIGPSGCGKSTLLRAIAGLEQPDAGTVSVFGVSPDAACEAKMVGLVPQAPALLPWKSVLQNVTLPQRVNRGGSRRRPATAGTTTTASTEELTHMLREVGLGDALDKLPAQLSGGMQQRVAIVRAFGLRPDVLLMDEPFSALDEFTRESLQEHLLDLWDEYKTTVVFVTHSVTEAVRLSDTVVVMAPRPGRIVDVIDIELSRPRPAAQINTPAFHHYEDLIRRRLQDAWRTPSTSAA
ncbi:ABC transporter ATP-binding protein [Microbacterium binotii]|uniref:ABC transporter ATP-binding protein n=1 Tax=Microbacterium binotii TaxID=462710 RepID=UPI001F2F6474|nr:ABC transporter ATP-binding protein [Microbacterium binotii]UIN31916.1 ABC transporter ATP-binding protein [Microbacterium binotii]